jgi:hypothetical protein
MSAVDQAYRYAINLPCDYAIVTSIRQTRLYFKGKDQQTYERFDTEHLAESDTLLKRFVFLLGAERVVPATGRCHFYDLLSESEQVGRELTKKFYLRYADIRQGAFEQLCRDNQDMPPHDVLTCAQKLLDRVLFCAFCEDRGLLPAETLRKAYEHRDPYHPRPIWENFVALFHFINRGNAAFVTLKTKGARARAQSSPGSNCFLLCCPNIRVCQHFLCWPRSHAFGAASFLKRSCQ